MSTIWNTWQQSVDSQGGYGDWSKEQLQAELEKRDLPKTGNKAELVARLEEDDG